MNVDVSNIKPTTKAFTSAQYCRVLLDGFNNNDPRLLALIKLVATSTTPVVFTWRGRTDSHLLNRFNAFVGWALTQRLTTFPPEGVATLAPVEVAEAVEEAVEAVEVVNPTPTKPRRSRRAKATT